MIERILIAVLTPIATRALTWVLERVNEPDAGKDVDDRLAQFKDSYKKAFDGNDITPEQRKELNRAISDFVRGTSSGL